MRDFGQVSHWTQKQVPRLSASVIHALEQQAGTRLVARVDLGEEPYFSFIPLAVEDAPCACLYRVALRHEATSRTLFEKQLAPQFDPPPMEIAVDLGEFAGQSVDLLLEIDAPDTPDTFPFSYWGSPAVYSRKVLPEPSIDTRPNVLLIGADTLRARELGAYGRTPSITPALDALARESDVWLEAFSTFNATNPSFTSIMTGLYGKNHGVYDNSTRLDEAQRTLAQYFQEAGYATGAVLSARHLQFADLGRGFRDVVQSEIVFAGELPVDIMMSWIAAQSDPFFAWIHLFDPHTPHTPPERYALGQQPDGLFGLRPVNAWTPFRELGPRTYIEPEIVGAIDLYDGEIAYLDRQIDRLLGFLKSRGLLERTILVFVADHGENLEEHGILYQHVGLWDTTTHIPMMIRWPNTEERGRQFSGLVQTIDLFPTLLDAAGIDVPPSDGQDLRSLNRSRGRRLVYAEHAGGSGAMIRTRTHKVIEIEGVHKVQDGIHLYDLEKHPDEEASEGATASEDGRRLHEELKRWLADRTVGRSGSSVALSPEEEAQLRALGYQ